MTRLVYVILVSFPFVIYYMLRSHYVSNHMEDYTELQRYTMVQNMIRIMKKNGRIHTKVFGVDNLPKEGGYVMYPNHQGKYDALGIISAHKEPCTFVIDEKRAELPIANEVATLLKASRLDKSNPRNQVKTIQEIIRQISDGRRYIIFPEGGYEGNSNDVDEFLPGTFKCSVRTHTPIIPVALIDSYKVFGINSLKKVGTEVHFLKPLYYEEYQKMSTVQIAEVVRKRIEAVISGTDQTVCQ